MIKTENFEKIEVTTREELRSWLVKNHDRNESFWLVTYKKSIPEKYVSRWDVLDELICFGWIDGIRRKADDEKTMQLISPRKVEHWAKSYKERAAKLIEEGKMHESGLKSIESSKLSGIWDFMDEVDKLIVPNDLLEELQKHLGAEEFFHSINPSSKRFVLRWVKLAKTEKTRQNRIRKLADLSAQGRKLPGS
ncbi:YdeI/OmpD-associated family protein [Algoriphagus sediminis]|uniref:YdeI/OmpD-associated family protein n=1 Tax=Algoriphagus sediminis TaxID=3057113 RepID=A0ABT7Y8Y7_9BACT|nr:YdeI/OmpD-associated family protein [Algoriphagus sediminis]MDN3202983.1 YdeI/OmpD-associated family protein [Algoriphagus sediminis]